MDVSTARGTLRGMCLLIMVLALALAACSSRSAPSPNAATSNSRATSIPASGSTAPAAASRGTSTSVAPTAAADAASHVPREPSSPARAAIDRVVVVWMENEEARGVTSSSMPYLYGLGQTYGVATRMYAITHPSEPNYLAFWSGSTQGVTDDGSHDINAPSLASQMSAAGLPWRVYAQNDPSGCYTGLMARDTMVDGWGVAGTYARKHNPAISFTSVSGNPGECANIERLALFDPMAAALSFVVPNLCDDAHDCPLAQGDAFLRDFLPRVFASPDWAHTELIVSFDEGSSSANGGGNVFTLVARAGLSAATSDAAHTHYGVLRTIENVFGLPCLGAACDAAPLDEFQP